MEVARYLGRLKELMDGKRKNGYAYGRGEKYSLELGGDINRAIASEFAMLAAPETLPLFLRKLQRKALKQYQRREHLQGKRRHHLYAGRVQFCGEPSTLV
jgi:uncharacterized protein with von Willebrand factor type A (vWA) domain